MSEPSLISFSKERSIHVGHIHAASVLDAVNVSQFGSEVRKYLVEKSNVNLLLDFRDVNYLSSAVLSELLQIREICTRSGGDLRLCALNDQIVTVFQITNLDKVLLLYDCDAHEAVKRFERSLSLAREDEAWGHATEQL